MLRQPSFSVRPPLDHLVRPIWWASLALGALIGMLATSKADDKRPAVIAVPPAPAAAATNGPVEQHGVIITPLNGPSQLVVPGGIAIVPAAAAAPAPAPTPDNPPKKDKSGKEKPVKGDKPVPPESVAAAPLAAPLFETPWANGHCSHRGSYEEIYNSIPFSRAEYLANPSYRHEATMEIMFGQLRPTTIVKHQAPPYAPPAYDMVSPYRRYELGQGVNYHLWWPYSGAYRRWYW